MGFSFVAQQSDFMMVVSHIIGGLGNQMFQYAAGRALSQRLHQPLLLDVGGFSDYQLHLGFELSNVFQCKAEVATDDKTRALLGWRSSQKMRSLLLKPQLKWLRGRHLVLEPHFHYWSGFAEINESCYLSGYWQSEKYFKSIASTIRQDFKFQHPLTGMNLDLAQEMVEVNSISLHVRRGDYVSNAHTNNTHGLCSLDYYRDAVAHIAENIASPSFFIFSDDIEWCREGLSLDFPSTYIDHNKGDDSYRDMQLMSLCDHHIIANSSFSWWGAWLNSNLDKIVIAPKQWFASGYRTDDLLPSEWLLL